MMRSLALIPLVLASAALADPVEIALFDRLDGDLAGYCLDISGAKEQANVEGGLQAHTCYSYQGASGIDQIFDADRFADGVLYMPEFDVCATVTATAAEAKLGLSACDGSAAQQIALTPEGKLTPAGAPDMCFTAGEDTRKGRGGTSPHQIKSLTLQTCSDDLAAYQTWHAVSAQ